MAIDVGDAVLKVGIDTKDMDKGLKGLKAKFEQHRKALSYAMVGIGAAASAMAWKSIQAASDVEEMTAKFDVVFGETAESVKSWAETLATAMGRSRFELMGMAASVQDTFVPMGFARDKAAEMAKTLTELAVDVGSFNNKLDADVMRDFQSALVGQTETVRKYGIVITQASLEQDILNRGWVTNKRDITEAMKIQARMNLILAGTTDAQGDAIRTSGSFANQMKRLQAEIELVTVAIGQELLPIAVELLPILGDLAKAMGPIILNTLNWHREYDKLANLKKANIKVELEHQRAVGGLTNEYRAAIDEVIALYTQQGKLTQQVLDYINLMEAEYTRVMGEAVDVTGELAEQGVIHNAVLGTAKELIDGVIVTTQLLSQAQIDEAEAAGQLVELYPTMIEQIEELEEAQKEAAQESQDLTDAFTDLMEKLNYADSAAGIFNISMYDLYDAMGELNYSTEDMEAAFRQWGYETSNVDKLLAYLGLTAKEVSGILEEQTDKAKELKGAFDSVASAAESAADMSKRFRDLIDEGGEVSEEDILSRARKRIEEAKESGRTVRQVAGQDPLTGFASGGIITQPTLLTRVGSSIPYGVMAEKGPERISPMGGGQSVNIIVELDGRTIAKAIGQPLVDLIRVKTAARI